MSGEGGASTGTAVRTAAVPDALDLVAEHYRCPTPFSPVQLPDLLNGAPGYFRFGPDLVLWGRLAGGPVQGRPDAPLFDAAPRNAAGSGGVALPFDPAEVLENLRRERYAAARRPDARQRGPRRWLRQAYYLARPLLPVPVRRPLQRLYLQTRARCPFPRWPVDTTVEDLLERLLTLGLQAAGLEALPFVWFWPDGFRAAVVMTHDVETPRGLEGCRVLMDLDEAASLRASFQLIPEGRYRIPDSLVREMRARGFEVNLHDLNHDGHLFDDRDEFLRRAARIGEHARALGARGFRAGALWRHPDWLEDLEVAYDMSIPNTGHLDPQPGGCCTVFPYRLGRLLELPLTTTQDYTLFHLLGEPSIALWQRQVRAIIARHGLVTFNVHPDYVVGDRRARAVYRALLEWLRELREQEPLWVAPPGEVATWWLARGQTCPVERAGGPTLAGPGTARGQVAEARVAAGAVICAVAPGNGEGSAAGGGRVR